MQWPDAEIYYCDIAQRVYLQTRKNTIEPRNLPISMEQDKKESLIPIISAVLVAVIVAEVTNHDD